MDFSGYMLAPRRVFPLEHHLGPKISLNPRRVTSLSRTKKNRSLDIGVMESPVSLGVVKGERSYHPNKLKDNSLELLSENHHPPRGDS